MKMELIHVTGIFAKCLWIFLSFEEKKEKTKGTKSKIKEEEEQKKRRLMDGGSGGARVCVCV